MIRLRLAVGLALDATTPYGSGHRSLSLDVHGWPSVPPAGSTVVLAPDPDDALASVVDDRPGYVRWLASPAEPPDPDLPDMWDRLIPCQEPCVDVALYPLVRGPVHPQWWRFNPLHPDRPRRFRLISDTYEAATSDAEVDAVVARLVAAGWAEDPS